MSKCAYFAKFSSIHIVDLILLQETHNNDASPPSKYTIAGFILISKVRHKKFILMTYAKNPTTPMETDATLTEENIYRSSIKIETINVVYIYKPPTAS